MARTLAWIGQRGRYCLIVGLLLGLFAPDLAQLLKPWIGTLVALLLFVTGIRVGAQSAFGHMGNLAPALRRVAVLQVVLPLAAIGSCTILGVTGAPIALAICLMLAAPSLTGAPNFAIMVGQDPAPGMRLLVLSTAVFPLTALPVLVLLDPAGGGGWHAFSLSLGLLGAILLSVGAGFAVRQIWPGSGEPSKQSALDGCAALLLAIVVVGLMSAIGPLLRTDPTDLVFWLLAALGVNIGLVLITLKTCQWGRFDIPVATAVFAGNRNIALFLIVLPESAAAPLMIFVGCYQIPMYLTPVLLTLIKARRGGDLEH